MNCPISFLMKRSPVIKAAAARLPLHDRGDADAFRPLLRQRPDETADNGAGGAGPADALGDGDGLEEMALIAGVIDDLDNDRSQEQHVYSIDISSADPTTVQTMMTSLFAGPNTKPPVTTETSALVQRENPTAAQQQQTSSTTGFSHLRARSPRFTESRPI